jgi:hypothetical protein
MEGLRIEAGPVHQFPGILGSIICRLTAHFWLIDTQSGPFNITDKPNFLELEAEIDQYLVEVPKLESTSSALWRPGIVAHFENLFRLDEWTSLTCLAGPETDAISVATKLDAAPTLSASFFDLVESEAVAFFLYVDGWWEVYSNDSNLVDELRKQKGVSTIQSAKWLRQQFGERSI